jgi:hypothetical protein
VGATGHCGSRVERLCSESKEIGGCGGVGGDDEEEEEEEEEGAGGGHENGSIFPSMEFSSDKRFSNE